MSVLFRKYVESLLTYKNKRLPLSGINNEEEEKIFKVLNITKASDISMFEFLTSALQVIYKLFRGKFSNFLLELVTALGPLSKVHATITVKLSCLSSVERKQNVSGSRNVQDPSTTSC